MATENEPQIYADEHGLELAKLLTKASDTLLHLSDVFSDPCHPR
jgi:hypothetical protein